MLENAEEKTYSSRGRDIFGIQDPLRLDDEKVDEFMDVPNKDVKSLPRKSVVLARSELGSQAIVQEGLPGNLSQNGNAQNHPGQLEGIAQDIDISSDEDQRDDGCVGNAGSSYR